MKSLLVLCFLLFLQFVYAPHTQAQGGSIGDKIAVKVDNYIILQSEIELAYQQLLSEGKITPDEKCQLVKSLVYNKIILAKSEIDSVFVEDENVEDQLDRRIDYLVQQAGGDITVLEKAYGKTMLQIKDELRLDIKEQMIAQEMQDIITENVKITPNEVTEFYKNLPKDSLIIPVEVEIGQIVMVPEMNKEQKRLVKEKLLGIREQIISGAQTFADMAKKHSQDPSSAKNGGDLGWNKRGGLVPEFEAAVFRMKANEISMPIESPYGYHLIQVIEKRGNEYNSRHILLRPTSSTIDVQYAQNYLDSIRTLIILDSITFEKAAKEFSQDKQTSSNGGYIQGSSGNKIEVDANFDSYLYNVIDTMKVGTYSRPLPFRTDDGKQALRIIYFKSRSNRHFATLKDDYDKIQRIALEYKKEQVIDQWFRKAFKQVYIFIEPEYKDCIKIDTQ